MAGVQAAWGVDVGVSSLKAIKLRRDGSQVIVEAFDVIEHDKFLTEEGVDRDAMIRATLQKLVAKQGLRRDVVFIGVPGNTAFARFVKLPPVETKKIPEIVRFEAIQQIPFPLEQVNWDYHTFQSPDSPDVEVGIFAMKKELVAQIMSNFRAADLNVQGVQMSPLAVYNAAAYDGMTADKGTVVIDMGAEHTDIVIMDQGRVWLRSIGIGGNNFTDALAKSFKQQFTKAEKLKKEAATSKYQKQIYQAMRPIFADLVAEIQRSLGAYNSGHRDSRLERIVGMGNPFKLPNLQKYLQQELKMDVVRLESFKNASIEKAAAFSENILSMSTAYGLAVQALGLATIDTNLLPTEIARQMMWKQKQPWFIAAAAVLVVGSLGMTAQWYKGKSDFQATQQDEYTANVLAESKDEDLLKGWKAVNDNYEVAVKAVQDQTSLVAARPVWPQVYADIMASLPPRVNNNPVIVLTDITSDYSNTLSSVVPAGAAGGAGAPPVAGVPAAGAPGAPGTPAASMVGESDHGFYVTVSGYARTGDRKKIIDFLGTLLNRAPVPPSTQPNDTQPAASVAGGSRLFYYEGKLEYGGHQIIVAPMGGGGGFGGGFGGGPPVAAGGGAQAGDKPWGNVKGPFWDLFFIDLTGYKPPAPAPGAPGTPGMGAGGDPNVNLDVPYPIDMVNPRQANPLVPRSMNGAYTFTFHFKIHIRNEIK